jgi:spore maturation protein CgeB
MSSESLNIVIIGLTITSSWGNGHATTYRGLVRELTRRGHRVLFLEKDVEWYASNRDMAKPPFGVTRLYESTAELRSVYGPQVKNADLVIVGSYVQDGIAIGKWAIKSCRGVAAFYDIDTPVTLAKLRQGHLDYLSPELIPKYALYLSFTGGPTLDVLQNEYGSPMARPLYCSVDPSIYFWEEHAAKWDLGYMGTYSDDRQPALERLLIQPARKLPEVQFVVAGPQYPESIVWPRNVKRVTHLSPRRHRRFYNSQRFTLNITRQDMVRAGYSPSVRLFEAAACGTPIISDYWEGIDDLFRPNKEILIARHSDDVVAFLRDISETERKQIGERARAKVLARHTAAHRAAELENYVFEILGRKCGGEDYDDGEIPAGLDTYRNRAARASTGALVS